VRWGKSSRVVVVCNIYVLHKLQVQTSSTTPRKFNNTSMYFLSLFSLESLSYFTCRLGGESQTHAHFSSIGSRWLIMSDGMIRPLGKKKETCASMQTIGAATRSASNRNEDWGDNDARELVSNTSLGGPTRRKPRLLAEALASFERDACPNFIHERQQEMQRAASREPLIKCESGVSIRSLLASWSDGMIRPLGKKKETRASMQNIGAATRSASNRNEDWGDNDPRELVSNTSLHGLTRRKPGKSAEALASFERDACPNFIHERQQEMQRAASREPLIKSKSGVSIHSLLAETTACNDELYVEGDGGETSRAQHLHRDVSTTTCITASIHTKDKRVSVTFAAQNDIFYFHIDPSEDATQYWHSALDNEIFLTDAKARAVVVNRMMKYASSNERTYNAATGLTAPQVLSEYLTIPEEVLGIEHMLSGQKNSRESLKRHHKSVLAKEMRRRQQEEFNDALVLADRLSERLRNTSNIAAHMAVERATFSTIMN
jgi:hypothetical protein